jgi:hypothetical protein
MKVLDKRPNPVDLVIWNVITSRMRAQMSYLHVQSDKVIVQQQHLASTYRSASEGLQ